MLRILIADDHAIIRKGLKLILLEEYPSAYIDEVSDASGVLTKVSGGKWDIIICDISMPGRSGLDVIRDLKQNFSNLPVLILSIHPEKQYAIRALKAGAAGYLSKDTALEELVKAVQKILLGRKYISSSIAEKIAEELNIDYNKLPHELLSDREFHVFMMIGEGKGISEIAESISLSVTTISTYRARILAKMDMKSNAELIKYAVTAKLL